MTAATNRPSKIGALRELLYALLREHARDDLLPTSARFLFYELVTRGQYGLNWTRIALTAQQVEQYDLPSITKSDRRYNDGHSHEAVETEAIGQGLLIEILQAWLERQLPEPLSRVQERETRHRKRLANRLRGRQ